MPEDKLLPPQWLMVARRNRKRFLGLVLLLLALCTILAFLALASTAGRLAVRNIGGVEELPFSSKTIVWLASWFRVFWVVIAAGCGAAILLALAGKIDSLVPALNIVLFLANLAALAFLLYILFVLFGTPAPAGT